MIYQRKLITGLAAVFFCAGCGTDHMQNDDVRALGASIDSARLEVSRHQDAITSATTLTEIPPEVDRHDHNIGDIMDAMDVRMGGMMSQCSGAGMSAMHDRMDAIASEMQSDRNAMLDAATLVDARNECTAHTGRMDGMLDEMQQSLLTVGCMSR